MTAGGRGRNRGGKNLSGSESTETINGYAVSYVQKKVKCSKPNCKKCGQPDGGHGPYWYKTYRTETGKVVTKYCGRAEKND
jgi:hypothetical protein